MKKILLVSSIFLLSYYHFAQQSNNMRLLANLNEHSADGQYSACWGYTASNGREYAILGCGMGTSFVDITDTNNIHEVEYLPGLNLFSCCREMKTYSHYCYVVADGIPSGLQIIDLQYLPDSVRLVNTFFFQGFTRGHTIQVEQGKPYLYICAGDYNIGGLFILDLSIDPINPIKRGEWETWVVHDCRVINDTIFACNIYNPPGTISVIDGTDKNNLLTIASWENLPQPGPHNIALTEDRRFAFVSDEIGGNPRLLKIWNITDINNTVKIAEWQPTGITTSIIHNVELYKNYLFAAHYTAGLRVIDVSNPYAPVEAAWYDTYPQDNGFTFNGCWGAYIFASEKIIASDRETGLYVFKTNFPLSNFPPSNPGNFSLKQNYPNPFNSSTKIEIDLPYNQYITLKLYDAAGKQVLTLLDGFMSKGTMIVNFDASNLPSGIYFYMLAAGNYTESRKMAFVK
ncbi:MAG: choice-of-anchor B family protein [Chlorobi bacterium]|nr:choice-of-anchor B family protein [Chlorobiota bacterium]MCI0715874.1 choice-of-anchor B family protein [Chlorobiota bacterium]